MSAKRAISIGLSATSLALFVPSAEGSRGDGEEPVVDAVREATARFRNVGYMSQRVSGDDGCLSIASQVIY